jgi:hypothetical protein
MAVTWAVSGNITEGVASSGKRTKVCVLAPTGTYTTGGDTLSPAIVGLKGITNIHQVGIALLPTGLSYERTGTVEAPLLKAYVAATGGSGASAEVAGGTSITGKSFLATIEGF